MENALEGGFACVSPASLRCRGVGAAGGWCWAGIGDAKARERGATFSRSVVSASPSCRLARSRKGPPGLAGRPAPEQAVGEYPVIDLMPEQEDVEEKGGTMRLGAYPCKVAPGSVAHAAYGEEIIYERHRHRYEVNNAFRDRLVDAGLTISGVSPDGRLVEMIELPEHPWFVASQGHPEFKSRPTRPHPLFRDFVAASLAHRKQ